MPKPLYSVCHIISAPAAGGAEIYVRDLVVTMQTELVKMAIVFMYDAECIGRDGNFQDDFLKYLHLNDIEYYFVGKRSGLRFSYFFKIRKLISQIRPDVLHLHVPVSVVYLLFSKLPVVYTHHTIKRRFPKWLFPILKKQINHTVAISSASEDILLKFGFPNIVRIDNAIIRNRFLYKRSDKNKRRREKGLVKLVALGRIIPEKNYSLLIDAVELLVKSEGIDSFNLSIAGEGSLEQVQKLEEKINSAGLRDFVCLIGQVNDVAELFAQSDIFVMSSSSEGLPISLIEATASGLASVVTDVGGCSEIISTCQSGYIVKSGDASGLALALKKLIDNPEHIAALSANALSNSSHYDMSRSAKEHDRIYKSILPRFSV